MTSKTTTGSTWRLIVANGKTVSAICEDGAIEDIMTCVNSETANHFMKKFNELIRYKCDLYHRLRDGD